jgi:hypothetical protein
MTLKSEYKYSHIISSLSLSIFSCFLNKVREKKSHQKRKNNKKWKKKHIKMSSDHMKLYKLERERSMYIVYTKSSSTYKYYSSDSIVGLWVQLSIWWSSNILFSGLQRPIGKQYHSETTYDVYMSDQKLLNAD